MPRRRETFDYIGLTPDRFEELVFLLAQLEVPGLVRTANPDGGLDALVPRAGAGGTVRGMQAKHHTRGPSATKCAESLKDAIVTYNPEHVTFAFPVNPTIGQIEAFERKVVASGVVVDYWGASQLSARLIGSDEDRRIARHIFGDEDTTRLERLIRAGQNVDDGAQALETLAAGADLLDSDPTFFTPPGPVRASFLLHSPPPRTALVLRGHDRYGKSAPFCSLLRR